MQVELVRERSTGMEMARTGSRRLITFSIVLFSQSFLMIFRGSTSQTDMCTAHRLVVSRPIHGDCIICTETLASGAQIGGATIGKVQRLTLRALTQASIELHVAVDGTHLRSSAGVQRAVGTNQTTGLAALDFDWF